MGLVGMRLVKTVVVVVAITAVVGGAYLAVPRSTGPVANASQPATEVAGSPTPSLGSAAPSDGTPPAPKVDATPTPTATPTQPAAPATPTASPTPRAGRPPTPDTSSPVATLQNPEGPPASDFPPDGYPFFETLTALPSYTLLWIDDNQRDVHVALTGEVEAVIEAIRDGVPSGVTVYFYLVEHSYEELCSIRDAIFDDREELMGRGIYLYGGGCGNAEHRVNIFMSPTTPEAIDFMRARYEGPIDYEGGGTFPLAPVEPVEVDEVRLVATRAGEPMGLHTCGHRPFASSALAAPAVDLTSEGGAVDGLRRSLEVYDALYGDLAALDWILAEQDVYGATFIADRGDTWLHAPLFGSADGTYVSATIEYCEPRPFDPQSGGAAGIYLDPDYRKPKPADTVVHVLVEEQACSGASNPSSRLLPPTVTYTADSVRIDIRVRPVSGGATCPGNPAVPVTILLPEPLGDRELTGITKRPDY